MRIVGVSSEEEMVASFLLGELGSERFGPNLVQVLEELGQPATLLTEADLGDAEGNELRRHVLGDFRGYRQDRELFTGFPDGVSWQRVALSQGELLDVRYIDYSYWTALTEGSRRPTDAVRFIRGGGTVFGSMPTGHFLALADSFRQGVTWQPIICVRADGNHPIVVLEGHARLTAMALASECLPDEVQVLLGSSAAMSEWLCY
ncbi:hypothetical protein AB0H36_43440 [Kribbella sp. NPDC050820]|uniref:hypothetical protein n=1 Tax=Kribbella sp. NPDC050820 TaxID=3155408 RepID=UPI0033F419BD